MKIFRRSAISVLIPVLACSFIAVFANEPESTSNGAITLPGISDDALLDPLVDETAVSPVEDRSMTEAPEENAADTQSVQTASPVLNVVLPATVSIVINPFELDDKAQVYSDSYEIRNLGDTDVLLTFTDMRCVFANDTDFEARARPFDEDTDSESKALYLTLDFGRDDIPPVVLTDANRTGAVSIPIRSPQNDPGGEDALSLSFSGNVSPYPAEEWRDGDVKIRLEYRMEAMPHTESEVEASDARETPPQE